LGLKGYSVSWRLGSVTSRYSALGEKKNWWVAYWISCPPKSQMFALKDLEASRVQGSSQPAWTLIPRVVLSAGLGMG
jgi:hypothetical protein